MLADGVSDNGSGTITLGGNTPVVDINAPAVEVEVTGEVKGPTPVLEAMTLGRGLTFKQRRELGVTFGNIRRVLAEMQSKGEIPQGATAGDLAVMVAHQLVVENPQAASDPTLDWDALLEFIERLIPLILQIISLFS